MNLYHKSKMLCDVSCICVHGGFKHSGGCHICAFSPHDTIYIFNLHCLQDNLQQKGIKQEYGQYPFYLIK